MGKERKMKKHQGSLAQQILNADVLRTKQRSKGGEKALDEKKVPQQEYVEARLSHKILEQARLQQEELEEEFGLGSSGGGMKGTHKKQKGIKSGRVVTGKDVSGRRGENLDDDDESEEDESYRGDDGTETSDYCPVILEEDEKAIEMFMSKEEQPRQTLATLIQDKIRDKETELTAHMTEASAATGAMQMDEKVISVFKGVAKILSKYRSGKLPKAFKVIPSLSNWEEVLHLTEPENWTAAAMFQATRIFSSNLSSSKAQRFYNLVLLPRIRDDISEFKRLNFHLYMASKKSLFKPAAFFKGLLLPLCESGTCTLREALIIGSVLAKNSVPMLHSSAAILKIAEMEYTGANSIFLRTLLDKKYALPYRVVDAVVFHFMRFATDERDLPVLWHQSLLTFVQRYKEDLSVEQKEALMELIRSKTHHEITPEIRREVVNSKCRDLGETFINRTQRNEATSMLTD